MTTVTWFQGARDGDWAVAGNWVGGAVPGLSATVSLSDTVANTITISAADYVIISGLVASGPINNRLVVAGGTLGVGGPADFGTGFTVTSGDVALAGTSSAGTGYDLGGTITLGTASTTLTLSGTGTLHADLQGPGTLITTGAASVTGGSIGAGVLAGGLVWQIKGTATFAPGATLHVTDPAALIAVTSSGSLTFAGDGGIVDSTGPAHVTNAGTITKTGGTGISELDGALVNSGTVSVTSGTLRLGSAISGSGTWSAGTGATLDLAGGGPLDGTFTTSGTGHLLLSAGTFGFTGTTRTLAASLALTGTIALGTGQTLTLSGSDSLNGTLTGPGTLVTSGATSISGGSIGGGLTWRMTSATTLTNGATLTVTDTASTIAVTSTGSLTFAGDGGIADSIGPAHITNAGTITKTGGTGISELDGALVNTGTVSVTSGTLRLGGAISGSGTWSAGTGATLDLAGGGPLDGTFTTSGTGHLLLSAGTFGFTGTTRTLTASLALTGSIALGTGQTLTLSGSDSLDGTLTGPGTLVTSSATSISGGSIGGGLTWRMTSATTLANGATLTVTDTASTIAVTSTGSLTFAGDGGILDSAGPAHLTNAGTIAKTGGTGISELDGVLVNTGTVSVTSGTLRLGGAISGSGTWSAGTGATLDLAGGGPLDGTFTTSGTGHLLLSAGTFGFTGTTRTLAASLALTGTIALGSGQTLTLSGSDSLDGTLTGPGTLVTSGATSISGGSIGGGLTWRMTSATTLTNGATLTVTDTASTIAVTSTGSLTFAGDGGIVDSAGLTHLTNAGTIAKTGGTGISELDGVLVNTGTVSVTSGTLRLGDTISGSGTWSAGTGATLDLAGGGLLDGIFTTSGTGRLLLSAGTFGFTGTARTLAASLALTGTIALGSGQTLTLSGSDSLNGTLTGPGTLVTSGATSISGGSIGGGLTWRMTSATTLTNGATLTFSDAASTIAVTSTGSLTFAGNGELGGPGAINNAGAIIQSAGTGTGTIDASLTNTGLIEADGGTLAVHGNFSNTGTLKLAGGQILLDGTGQLGGTLIQAGADTLTIRGTYTIVSQSAPWNGVALHGNLELSAGQTFALGTGSELGNLVTGAGTLVLGGVSRLMSGEVWQGATVAITGTTTLTDGTYELGGPIGAIRSGVLRVMAGGTLLLNGAAPGNLAAIAAFDPADLTSVLAIDGTLAKTDASTSLVSAPATVTGTVDARAGVLSFSGTLTNAGTLLASGGTLVIDGALATTGAIDVRSGGALTLAGGGVLGGTATTAGTAQIDVTAGSYRFAGSAVDWSAAIRVEMDTRLSIDSGQTVRLEGSTTFMGTAGGPGTLVLAGAATLENATFGAGATVEIAGTTTLLTGGTFDTAFGPLAGMAAARLAIDSGGTVLLGHSASLGDNDAVHIANAGTIGLLTGTDFATVNATLINSGTIFANAGRLRLDGTLINTGILHAGGGAAILVASAVSGTGGIAVDAASEIDLQGGGTLPLTYSVAATGRLVLDGQWTLAQAATTMPTGGGTVTLSGDYLFNGGQTLHIDHAVTLDRATFEASNPGNTGGTLVTSADIAEGAGGITIGAGQTWEMTAGTVAAGAGLWLNGTVQVDSGATLALGNVTDAARTGTIRIGGTATFGADGTGSAQIDAHIVNTGLFRVTAGTLWFDGELDGTGTLVISAGATAGIGGVDTLTQTVANEGTLLFWSPLRQTLGGQVTNNGTISVSHSLTISASVGGTGTILIAGGALLELAQLPATAQTVSFAHSAAGHAHLQLDALGALTVANIADGDSVDLSGITLASATITGNTVLLTTGTGQTATLTSVSSLAGLDAQVSGDGHDGSLITFTGHSLAVPAIVGPRTVSLGKMHAGTTLTHALQVTNAGATDGSGQALTVTTLGTTGAITVSGAITGLIAGATSSANAMTVTFAPGKANGTVTGTATLGFTSLGSTSTALAPQTVTYTAQVYSYAAPSFTVQTGYSIKGSAKTGYTLDLGSVALNSGNRTVSIGVANAAKGLADTLSGAMRDSTDAAFSGAAKTLFSPLAAGQGKLIHDLTVSTAHLGVFTDTITLTPQSHFGNDMTLLPSITLTVTIHVTTAATTSWSLTGKTDSINGSATANSAITTRAGDLGTADRIDGGPGANTFTLLGKGAFNLNTPAQLTRIGTIIATEGQAASGALPATMQTVTMRNGETEALQVQAGTAAAGNAKPLGITINTGTGHDTIVLSTGHDTVRLGSGQADITLGAKANAVHGGSGTATIHAKAGQAGALIVGTAPGTLTLDITTKGKATLNAHDADLTVAIKAGSTLDLSKGTGIVADASAGHDSVIAHAAGQVMIGGDGDIFTSAGGDTFRFGAGFGHETINGFVGTGAGHDTLAFAHTLFADAAHVLSAAAQVGSDVVITLDAADTITLAHVALASLSAQDVLII